MRLHACCLPCFLFTSPLIALWHCVHECVALQWVLACSVIEQGPSYIVGYASWGVLARNPLGLLLLVLLRVNFSTVPRPSMDAACGLSAFWLIISPSLHREGRRRVNNSLYFFLSLSSDLKKHAITQYYFIAAFIHLISCIIFSNPCLLLHFSRAEQSRPCLLHQSRTLSISPV